MEQIMEKAHYEEGARHPFRTCTCHPDDNPPRPCPGKYAYSECIQDQGLTMIEVRKMGQIMEKAHYEEGARHPSLGPHYFAARDIVRAFADKFEAEQFEPLLKSFSQRLYEKALEDWQAWLLADVEINVQGAIRHMVDDTVKALLTGEVWALERYPLAQDHDGASIRAAVAKHMPAELQNRRITDLEAEVARLRVSLQARM